MQIFKLIFYIIVLVVNYEIEVPVQRLGCNRLDLRSFYGLCPRRSSRSRSSMNAELPSLIARSAVIDGEERSCTAVGGIRFPDAYGDMERNAAGAPSHPLVLGLNNAVTPLQAVPGKVHIMQRLCLPGAAWAAASSP